MKTKQTNKAAVRYPLRAILATTLIIAQLGAIPAQSAPPSSASRSDAPGLLPRAAQTVTAANGAAKPADLAAPGTRGAGAQTGTANQNIASTQNPQPPPAVGGRPVAPVGTTIPSVTIGVDQQSGRAKEYTFLGKVIEATEAGIAGQYQAGADGIYRPVSQLGIRTKLELTLEGCNGSCKYGKTTMDMINGVLPTDQEIQAYLGEQAKKIDRERRRDENERRRREDCTLVTVYNKDGDSRDVRIENDDDAKKWRTAILECNVENAKSGNIEDFDDNYDTNHETSESLMTKIMGEKIGGVLRRNMISDDPADRAWSIERLSKLVGQFKGSTAAYIEMLLKGARQIDHTFKIQNASFALPGARNQINQQFEAAAQAWQQASLRYMNVSGASEASLTVYELMKSKGCTFMNETMSPGIGQHQTCTNIDSIVQDGRESSVQDLATNSTVQQGTHTVRGQRFEINPGANPGNVGNSGPTNINMRSPNPNGEMSAAGFNGQTNYRPLPGNQPIRGGNNNNYRNNGTNQRFR